MNIEFIEESKNVKVANAHDYYFVPAFYVDKVYTPDTITDTEARKNLKK